MSAAPAPLVTKAHRQETIRSIVRDAAPRSQEDLLKRLRGAGIRITQSTLSRDLHEIGLVKGPGGYSEAGAPAAEERSGELERMARSYLARVARAGTLVVLKTPPGLAHGLAVALDRAGLPGAVGSVAGDDTVFLAAADERRARLLERRLAVLMAHG